MKGLKMRVKVDKKRLAKIHVLLAQLGLAKDKELKADMIKQYSGGRETSSKELYVDEAGELITALEQQVKAGKTKAGKVAGGDAADKKRKLMIHLGYGMNWTKENGKIDMKRIDDWCLKYGQYHKPLMEHSVIELSDVLVQLERAYKDFLKGI